MGNTTATGDGSNEAYSCPDEPEYLTGKQLARKINVSLKAVTKWTAARRLPGAYKMGRVWRYQWREIEKRLLTGNLLYEKR